MALAVVLADLMRARTAVLQAELATRPSERFLAGHTAALRVAAIILVLRTSPAIAARPTRPRNAWELVAVVAPEFAEWAGFFAATEGKRDAVRAGASSIVTAREADDLVRDVGTFFALVEQTVHRGTDVGRPGALP